VPVCGYLAIKHFALDVKQLSSNQFPISVFCYLFFTNPQPDLVWWAVSLQRPCSCHKNWLEARRGFPLSQNTHTYSDNHKLLWVCVEVVSLPDILSRVVFAFIKSSLSELIHVYSDLLLSNSFVDVYYGLKVW